MKRDKLQNKPDIAGAQLPAVHMKALKEIMEIEMYIIVAR